MKAIGRLLGFLKPSLFTKHFIQVANAAILAAFFLIALSLDGIRPFNYINIALFAALTFLTVLYYVFFVRRIDIDVYDICLIVIGSAMLISYCVNGFAAFPKTPLLTLLVSFVVYKWLKSQKDYLDYYLLFAFLVSVVFAMVFAVFERRIVFHPSLSSRNTMALGNNNDVARHLVFALIICVFQTLRFKKSICKAFGVCISSIFAYFLVLTGSISNLLLCLVSFALTVLLITRGKKRILAIGVLAFLAVVGALLLFLVPQLKFMRDRVVAIFATVFGWSNHYDSSAAGRLSAAINGFTLWLKSPLFGNGFDSVVRSYDLMAHNNIAEISADYGVFALLFEEARFIVPLVALRKVNKETKPFVLLMGIYLLLLQFALVCFNSKTEAILIPALFVVTNPTIKVAVPKKNAAVENTIEVTKYVI